MVVVGSGKEVSRWTNRGFKCCLDAKVVLLSDEPCGFISRWLAELIFGSAGDGINRQDSLC